MTASSSMTRPRSLDRAERRRLVALALPTLALALAITTVSTYLPVVLQGNAGSTLVIGLIIGSEGLMALFVRWPGAQPARRVERHRRGGAVHLAGAATMGRVADRFGRLRVMRLGIIGFGTVLLVHGIVGTEWAAAAVAPFLAFCGGAVMALPYGILMPLMPEEEHGRARASTASAAASASCSGRCSPEGSSSSWAAS